jgi:hypothetical protein
LSVCWSGSWPLAIAPAAAYVVVIARSYRGKVRPAQDSQGFY